MVSARAIGLMVNDPQRAHLALYALADQVRMPEGSDGFGVAVSVDGSVLLSRVPGVAAEATLAALIGPLKGRCAVVQVRSQDELRPHGPDTGANLGPFRARAFAGAVVGGPQDPDEAALSRDALLATVPDFLKRSINGQSEGEAFFLAAIARLHTKGLLEGNAARGRALAEAIQETLEAAPICTARHVSLTNGFEVVHVSQGMPSAILTVAGISEQVANLVDPTLADSSMGRERLRRFRGVLALGGLDQPLKANATLPSGFTVHALPLGASALIGRELQVELL